MQLSEEGQIYVSVYWLMVLMSTHGIMRMAILLLCLPHYQVNKQECQLSTSKFEKCILRINSKKL